MKWNDMLIHEKGRILNAVGIAVVIVLAMAASVGVLLAAILLAPWPIKVAAGVILVSSALVAVGSYCETR